MFENSFVLMNSVDPFTITWSPTSTENNHVPIPKGMKKNLLEILVLTLVSADLD